MAQKYEDISMVLESHGIRATSNRVLVLRTLMEADGPLTMKELEDRIESLDKSSIFRVLVSFKEKHLVHGIDTCDEGTKYEFCHADHEKGDSDEHLHFHCSRCHRTFCFEEIPVPVPVLPDGYLAEDVSYVVTGVCPECRAKGL